jgi:hypothetical protein
MLLIKIWLVTNLLSVIIGVPYMLYKDHVKERELKEIVNLPRDELLRYALADPELKDDFIRYSRVMPIDLATELVTNHWLINNRILYLRDDET